MFRNNNARKENGQAKSFMEKLDEWTRSTIIEPLEYACFKGSDLEVEVAENQVKKAIREKVLESYRNGQSVGPRDKAARSR